MRKLVPLAACVLIAGCAVPNSPAADNAAAAFHRDLNAGRFATIYDGASADFKKASNAHIFNRLLTVVSQKLGPYQSSKQQGITVMAGTDGTRTTAVYKSQFAKGAAVETFVFREDGERMRLLGYNVNSPTLVLG